MKRSTLLSVLSVLLGSILILWGCASQELTSAKLYIQQENWEKAEEFLIKALDTEPENPEVPYLLGDLIYGEQQGNWEKMDEMFKRAMEIDPDAMITKNSRPVKEYVENSREKYWVMVYNKGTNYFNQYIENRDAPQDERSIYLEKAIEQFEDALIIYSSKSQTYTILATCYLYYGDPDKAEETAKKAVRQDPEDVSANITTGQIMGQLNKPEMALPFLKKAVDLEPNNIVALRNLAQTYLDVGDTMNSIYTYEKAVRNETDRQTRADLHFNLGLLYMKVGDFKSAEDNFITTYDLNPNDLEALLGIAQTFEEAEKWSRSENFYKEMVTVAPDDPRGYRGLARVLLRQGKKDEAEHYFEKSQKLGN